MKTTIVAAAIFLALLVIAFMINRRGQEPMTHEEPPNTSEFARIGIEAGINACLVDGTPSSQEELDRARIHARRLMERLYPEIQWHWPKLKTNGIGTNDA